MSQSNEISDIEKSIYPDSLVAGTKVVRVNRSDGTYFEFQQRTPTIRPEKKYPLVIALHWAGDEQAFKVFSRCLAEPGSESLNAFVISPSAEKNQWEHPDNEEKILALIANAKKHWPINPDRIIIIGYSLGGNGVFYMAKRHPELFYAGIAMASSHVGSDPIGIPMYVIHSEQDELFPVTGIEKSIQQVKAESSPIIFRKIERLTHYEACRYVDYLKEGIRWAELGKW